MGDTLKEYLKEKNFKLDENFCTDYVYTKDDSFVTLSYHKATQEDLFSIAGKGIKDTVSTFQVVASKGDKILYSVTKGAESITEEEIKTCVTEALSKI